MVGPFKAQHAHMRCLQKPLPDVAGWHFELVLKPHVDERLTPSQAATAALQFGSATVTVKQILTGTCLSNYHAQKCDKASH
jgi:hypothetical protein